MEVQLYAPYVYDAVMTMATADGVAGQLAQRLRAQAIAAHELGLDAQRLHLAQRFAEYG